MSHRRTRFLLVGATLISGLLVGGIVDRVIVGGPAWHKLGADAWAQYSREADLGTGIIAYPIEGIGATLLAIAAAISNWFDGNSRRVVTIPLYWAAALSLAGLLFTAKAAPIMLGLTATQSHADMQRAFEDFFLWGLYVRGSADLLAFVALVWALSTLDHEAICS
jgi:hypothetical protein